MAIGKIAATLLNNPVTKTFADPLNVGISGYSLAAGDQSLGEALTGTAVGVPAFHYVDKGIRAGLANVGARAQASKSGVLQYIGRKISPRLYTAAGKAAKMVPGPIGKALGAVGGMAAAMTVVPPAMKAAKKYFPIWKRKVPTGQPG